jgi:uncharacterized protein (DUF58 family)
MAMADSSSALPPAHAWQGWLGAWREAVHWRFESWLKQRLPRARETTLDQSKIFIVPSKTALTFMGMIAVLLLLGINFQNSLVYAVCFWLIALLVVNIFYTWRNLSGLTIRSIGVEPCFAGEKAVVELELACHPEQQKIALDLTWAGEDAIQVNLVANHTQRIKLSHSTTQRGLFQPPRLHIATRYPTGLVVAWSYITPDVRGLVYPQPLEKTFPSSDTHEPTLTEGGVEIAGGTSDFGGIREYRHGDAPKHVHWKKFAQTGKLYTRSFVDYASHERWLDWDSLPIPGIEVRLAHLCSRVLSFHQEQREFGLKLPGKTIAPAKGELHRAQCLRALALFGITEAGADHA